MAKQTKKNPNLWPQAVSRTFDVIFSTDSEPPKSNLKTARQLINFSYFWKKEYFALVGLLISPSVSLADMEARTIQVVQINRLATQFTITSPEDSSTTAPAATLKYSTNNTFNLFDKDGRELGEAHCNSSAMSYRDSKSGEEFQIQIVSRRPDRYSITNSQQEKIGDFEKTSGGFNGKDFDFSLFKNGRTWLLAADQASDSILRLMISFAACHSRSTTIASIRKWTMGIGLTVGTFGAIAIAKSIRDQQIRANELAQAFSLKAHFENRSAFQSLNTCRETIRQWPSQEVDGYPFAFLNSKDGPNFDTHVKEKKEKLLKTLDQVETALDEIQKAKTKEFLNKRSQTLYSTPESALSELQNMKALVMPLNPYERPSQSIFTKNGIDLRRDALIMALDEVIPRLEKEESKDAFLSLKTKMISSKKLYSAIKDYRNGYQRFPNEKRVILAKILVKKSKEAKNIQDICENEVPKIDSVKSFDDVENSAAWKEISDTFNFFADSKNFSGGDPAELNEIKDFKSALENLISQYAFSFQLKPVNSAIKSVRGFFGYIFQ